MKRPGYTVLGASVWFGSVRTKGHRLPATVALLSFPVASIVGELVLIAIWITVGGVSGILGGWLSGLALARMLTRHAPIHML